MFNQTQQLFNAEKEPGLMAVRSNEQLDLVAVKTIRDGHAGDDKLKYEPLLNDAQHNEASGRSGGNASVCHARNFMVNAVAISICMTALLLSMNTLPVIYKVMAFCGSLMVGFIIEYMLNGDEYE